MATNPVAISFSQFLGILTSTILYPKKEVAGVTLTSVFLTIGASVPFEMEDTTKIISLKDETRTALEEAARVEEISPSELTERILHGHFFKTRVVGPMALTFTALIGLGAIVYFIMHFATSRAGLGMAYWLVPIFGSVGGAVGGLLRKNGKLVLACIQPPGHVDLGLVGDICIGLGGACAVLFLFGNTLRVMPDDAASNVLLISISFLAGVIGKQLIERASNQLAKQAVEKADEAEATAKVAAEKAQETDKKVDAVARVAAQSSADTEKKIEETTKQIEATRITPLVLKAYRYIATQKVNENKFDEALECIEEILKYAPKDIYAYVEKGRLLKRQNKVTEALEIVEQGLTIDPDDRRLLYNRACYKAILNMNEADIIADLKRACDSVPQYCESARKDADLERVRDLPAFKKLMLDTLDRALRERPHGPETPLLMYSKACYLSRFHKDKAEIIALLSSAVEAEPKFKDWAVQDKERDLAYVSELEKFKKLIGSDSSS